MCIAAEYLLVLLPVKCDCKGYYISETLVYTIHSDIPVGISENPSRFLLDASGRNSSTVQLVRDQDWRLCEIRLSRPKLGALYLHKGIL